MLHLLRNIADLPVTASMVKQSGLGKLVGSIEKHRVCSGSNEGNIRENVHLVKSSWKASVKARKIAEGASQPQLSVSVVPKREAPTSNEPLSPSAKRAKVAESSPKSSLSSLLNRMSGKNSSNSQSSPASASMSKTKLPQANGVKAETTKSAWKAAVSASTSTSSKCDVSIHIADHCYALSLTQILSSASPPASATKKKQSARVKWADHFGGDLIDSRLIEGETVVQNHGSSESWSDRKKRDREKEKKLLLTMKYVFVSKVGRVMISTAHILYATFFCFL